MPPDIMIKPTTVSLLPFASKHISPLEEIMTTTSWGSYKQSISWIIINDDALPGKAEYILSCATAEKLGILRFCNKTPKSAYKLKETISHDDVIAARNTNETIKNVIERYLKVFKGLGKLESQPVKLYIKPDATPSIQPNLPIPYHLQNAFVEAINQMTADDVIEEHVGPGYQTQW